MIWNHHKVNCEINAEFINITQYKRKDVLCFCKQLVNINVEMYIR